MLATIYTDYHRWFKKQFGFQSRFLFCPTPFVVTFPDHVLQVGGRRMTTVRPQRPSHFDRANFFHGLLGANIVFSDEEHNALNKLEGVIEQQSFHFRVEPTAPVFSREK